MAQEKKDNFYTSESNKIDFSETLIEGKMQAPQGFFLQGKSSQQLTNMVQLRKDFKPQLRSSKAAVRANSR